MGEKWTVGYMLYTSVLALDDMQTALSKIWMYSLVGRVFANGPGDQVSIPRWVTPKTFKNGTWYLLA